MHVCIRMRPQPEVMIQRFPPNASARSLHNLPLRSFLFHVNQQREAHGTRPHAPLRLTRPYLGLRGPTVALARSSAPNIFRFGISNACPR